MNQHKKISFIKSGVRLIGCFLGILAFPGFYAAAFYFLFIAEILGIIEEC